MKRLLLAGVLAAFAIPALAQTTTVTEEYFVVQDPQTKRCTIVDKRPTSTTTGSATVQVGPVAFKTRTEAEQGMKTIKVCETQ